MSIRSALAHVLAAGALAVVPALHAQGAQHPVSAALRQDLQREQRNLVAAAEAMPADKYGFKPTPAQMSFGQLVLHVAGSNEFICGGIAGTKAPARAKLTPAAPKAELVARMRESFAFCSSALAGVTDSDLAAQLPFFGGRTISRAGMMLDIAGDWADHYGAMAMYLRLNGILPPTARPAPRK